MRKHPKEQRLSELEADFEPLLVSCMRWAARGKWGLFGQNDTPEARKHLNWPDAEKLKEMAGEIRTIREEFGQRNPLVVRYEHYCSRRGPNDLGEPKLAVLFLRELGLSD